jgi:hypothetical protein
MIIRQDRLGMEKERRNDKRAGAAGARVEEADRTTFRRTAAAW